MFLLLSCAPPTPVVVLEPAQPTSIEDITVHIETRHGYRLEWFRDGEPMAIGGETVPAENTRRGERWGVQVTPVRRGREGEPAKDGVTVGNAPPTATVVVDAVHAEQPLVATAAAEDPDGDPVVLSYAWYREGELTELADATVISTWTANGELWEVAVTPFDGVDEGEPARAGVVIGNAPPEIQSVTILPSPPTSNDLLSTEVEAIDVDGDTIDLLHVWFVDGEQVSEEPTLDPVARGHSVAVQVTPYDGQQVGETVESDPVVIRNGSPEKPSVIIVSQSTHAGWDATCETEEAVVDPDGDVLEESTDWFIDGTKVDGPTDTTEGQQLTCVMELSDGHGASVKGRDDITVLWACGLKVADAVSGPGKGILSHGDVDADGHVDLLVDDRVWWGPGFEVYSELGMGLHSGVLGIGDLDGDGVPEIVGGDEVLQELHVLWGDGTLETLAQGDDVTDVGIADVSGDGSPDIVMQCASGLAYRPVSGGVIVGQTNLNSRFGSMRVVGDRAAQLDETGSVWMEDIELAAGVIGFDSDGEDLLVWSFDEVVLLEADGVGGFGACPLLEGAPDAVADLDGNGKPDLVSVLEGWEIAFTE